MGSVIDNPTIKKHSLYKDSGVKWLEKIPSNWHSKPLFTIGKVISNVNCQDRELLSVYLERGVIKFSDVTEKRTNVTSEDLSKYQAVDPGNLVLNNQQAWRGSVGVSKYSGIVSPAYIVLALSDEIDYDFANYLFRDSTMVSHYLICSKGVGTIQRNLYWPQLKRVNVCIPPLTEQTAIAEFLDRKTVLIDQAIDIKQKQIELLKERRQILIHKAVTRGLNANVKMKDSGVEWIGEIPEHWKIKRLKYILNGKLKYGANESGIEYDISLPRYIRITDFGQDGKLSEVSKLSLSWKQGGDYLLRDGDILFARSGATVGKTYQFKKSMSIEDNYCYAGYLIKAEANEDEILSDFLYLYTNSTLFNNWKDGIFIKSTIENIGADKYSVLPVVIPSIKEQIQILEKYRSDNERISIAISLKEQEIEKLKEYKATLINSAVTGKIKVYNDAK